MDSNFELALKKYVATMKVITGRDLTENDLNLGVFGTPDDCIKGFEKYVAAGVRHFVLNPYPHPESVKEWFKNFKEKVIPHFV